MQELTDVVGNDVDNRECLAHSYASMGLLSFVKMVLKLEKHFTEKKRRSRKFKSSGNPWIPWNSGLRTHNCVFFRLYRSVLKKAAKVTLMQSV